jgi:hypothetical protein
MKPPHSIPFTEPLAQQLVIMEFAGATQPGSDTSGIEPGPVSSHPPLTPINPPMNPGPFPKPFTIAEEPLFKMVPA